MRSTGSQLFTENHQKSGRQDPRCRTITPPPTAARSFDKTLREQVVFSDHSLVTDAVFAEMQLISCRNVLIYFDRALAGSRPRPVPRLAGRARASWAWAPRRACASPSHADAFTDFVREEKIYQRRDA